MAKRTSSKAKGPVALTADMRVIVLSGKDAFQQAEHAADVGDLLRERHGELDTVRFDGPSTTVGEVLDECRTFGLMVTHKLVIVTDADAIINEGTRIHWEAYAPSPSDSATLVLRATRWFPGKLDKAIVAGGGAVVKCEPMSDADACAWAIARAKKQHGVVLDTRAAGALVERLGGDLGRIDTETAKLAVLARSMASNAAGGKQDSGSITRELVAEHVGRTREEELWQIQAPILRSPEAGIRYMRSLTENGAKDASVPISWACLDLASKLHAASRLRAAGMPSAGIGKALRLWGPSADAILGAAQGLRPDVGSRVLDAAVETDRAIKSVSSGKAASVRALEGLALRLGALGQRARRG